VSIQVSSEHFYRFCHNSPQFLFTKWQTSQLFLNIFKILKKKTIFDPDRTIMAKNVTFVAFVGQLLPLNF
jgi:hypothetical protein